MNLTVDGRAVFASTGGRDFDPDRPVVVFLHGAGFDHTAWMLQARYFAHHGRAVLNVDLPGNGRSAGPALPTVADMAAWMEKLLDAVQAPKAALVGHSMGAFVALESAARAPARVWALALLGVAARMPVHPDLQRAAESGDHAALDLMTSWGYGRWAHFGGSRVPGLWMMGSGLRLLERTPKAALATALAACNAYKGATDAAAKVLCPTLLLLGEIDRMTPPVGARDLATRISDARTVILPHAGHMMMIEQPDETIAALAEII
ncbi:MAG TPA: alpha/beta hydrolase [Alphaproteobacteria bacterium]|nr:alpha/beta hydrolase [Alphaproteobacteria bacterium]